MTREVYTPTYAAALDRVAGWMEDVGLAVRLDAVGNLFGRWRAPSPTRRSCSPAPTSTRRSTPAATTACSACSARSRRSGCCGSAGGRRAGRSSWSPGRGRSRASARAASAAARPPACSPRDDLDALRDRGGVSMAAALREAGFDPDRLGEAELDPAAVHALRRAAHRAGRGARVLGRRDRRRDGDRGAARLHGWCCAARPRTRARRRWACGATRSPARPRSCSRSSGSPAPRRAARPSAPSAWCARAPGRSTWCPARSSSTSTCATPTSRRGRAVVEAILAAAREVAASRGLELEVAADRRGCAGGLRARGGRRGRGGRGGGGRAGAAHDLRRLPRRDDPRRARADRDDLRAERGRHQPPPGRVHRARRTSTAACGCSPARWRGWRHEGAAARGRARRRRARPRGQRRAGLLRLHARVARGRRRGRRRPDRGHRRVRRRRAHRRRRPPARARLHRRARAPRVGEAAAVGVRARRSSRAGRPRSSAIRTRSPTCSARRARCGCSTRPRGSPLRVFAMAPSCVPA